MGAISSNGRSNMSCSTKATRSAGASASSTTSSARPTESASSASRSGSAVVAHGRHRLAARPPAAPRAATCASARCRGRRAPRPWSASRARFPMSAASVRPSRSQASCTASSASPGRAQHAVGHAAADGRGSPRSARPSHFSSFHRSHSPIALRHAHDGRAGGAGTVDKGDDHAITDDQPRFRGSRGAEGPAMPWGLRSPSWGVPEHASWNWCACAPARSTAAACASRCIPRSLKKAGRNGRAPVRRLRLAGGPPTSPRPSARPWRADLKQRRALPTCGDAAVTDDVWKRSCEALRSRKALADLVLNIALINFWNQVNVTIRQVSCMPKAA